MAKGKTYTKDFKFKIAVEMLRGELSTAQIAGKYQVPSSVASRWKNELLDRGADIFGTRPEQSSINTENQIERLHATIGKLKVESDFLHKASSRLRQ